MNNYRMSIAKQEKKILEYLYENNKIDSILSLTRIIFNDKSITKKHSKYISIFHSVSSLLKKSLIRKEKYFIQNRNSNKLFSHNKVMITLEKEFLDILNFLNNIKESRKYLKKLIKETQ